MTVFPRGAISALLRQSLHWRTLIVNLPQEFNLAPHTSLKVYSVPGCFWAQCIDLGTTYFSGSVDGRAHPKAPGGHMCSGPCIQPPRAEKTRPAKFCASLFSVRLFTFERNEKEPPWFELPRDLVSCPLDREDCCKIESKPYV